MDSGYGSDPHPVGPHPVLALSTQPDVKALIQTVESISTPTSTYKRRASLRELEEHQHVAAAPSAPDHEHDQNKQKILDPISEAQVVGRTQPPQQP